MVRRRSALLLLLGLAACNDGTPLAAYKHPTDAAARILPLDLVGIYSCADARVIDGTKVIEGRPFDQCYKMQPKRRFRGIWLDQFEESTFFEGATDAAATRQQIGRECFSRHVKREWLAFADERLARDDSGHARLVAVDFIGRRTAFEGSYGHMGAANSEVLVDRVIAARPLYVSAQPYLEQEFARCIRQ